MLSPSLSVTTSNVFNYEHKYTLMTLAETNGYCKILLIPAYSKLNEVILQVISSRQASKKSRLNRA